MSDPRAKPFTRARWPYWETGFVLLVGGAVTVILCVWLRGKALAADRARLHEEAWIQIEIIETRIEMFVEMLHRLQDQLARTPVLDAAHWDGLVWGLNLRGNYPGLAAVGFWQYQPPDESLRLREGWQAMGLSPPRHSGNYGVGRFIRSFHSTVKDTTPAYDTITTRKTFVPDEYLWSKISWNVGVGPGSLPGQEVFDGRSQTPDRGFRILLPVFHPERHPRELMQQRYAAANPPPAQTLSDLFSHNDWGNLGGILYGEFALKKFVGETLGDRRRGVEFVIYDADAQWSKTPNPVLTPIYGAPPAPGRPSYLEERLEMKHYGRRLVFDFYTTPAFAPHSLRRWPLMAALMGGCVTLLMAGLVGSQTRARLREQADADRLRAANEQLTAALHDRERISRELHDGALQSVYAVGLGLAHCRNIFATQPGHVPTLLAESINAINSLVTELRQFLLNPKVDIWEGGSLEAMLKTLAGRIEITTATRVAVRVEATVADSLPAVQSQHLMNLVREAVSNSIRHGEPVEVLVILGAVPGGWRLEVRDDGCGFDPEAIDAARGHGLRNMRARAAELGATFMLESQPGSGTLVRIECATPKS